MSGRTGTLMTTIDAEVFAPVTNTRGGTLMTTIDAEAFWPSSRTRTGFWQRSYNTGFLPDLETPMTIVQVLVNTATTISVFMRDGSTGLGLPGISPSAFTIKLKKSNQSAFSTISPTVTETGLGWYDLALTGVHTDTTGKAPMEIAATGALTRDDVVLDVISLNKFTDSVRAGLTALPNAAAGGPGGLASLGIRVGTAQGPGNGVNQIQLDTGASAVDGFYARTLVTITGGTGAGQSRFIVHYIGSTKTATVNRNWVTQPDASSVFGITAISNNLLTQGLAQAGGATTITLKSTEPSTTDFYKGVWIHLMSGAGAGQARLCTGYNGTTKVATVDTAWATVPDATTAYEVMTGADVVATSVVATTDVNVTKWLGQNVVTPTTPGIPKVEAATVTGFTLYAGTAQGPGTGNNQIQLDVGASSVNDIFHRANVSITGGTGAGQSRAILAYNGTTKTATVDHNWVTNPDATSTFAILANSSTQMAEGLAQGGGASTITLGATEPSTTDFYKGSWIGVASGAGQGQARLCVGYDGTTKIATVSPAWATQPNNTSAYTIAVSAAVLLDASSVTAIQTAILDAARSGHVVLGSIGEGIALATSLLQGNFFIDNVDNSGSNGPLSQRLRCWTSAAAMASVTPGGTGEGEFATFLVTTTYSGPNKIVTHKVVQQ